MKLHFLGTGAADWDIKTRQPEDTQWRRFSSTLVDDKLLIDPGPHIFDYAEMTGQLHLFDNVTDIIITHSHQDHFNCQNTLKLCSGGRNCRVWGDMADLRKLYRVLGEDMTIDFHPVTPGQKFTAGGYKILPLHSNHATTDKDEITLNYIISKNGQKMFYGLDTGWFRTESWNIIRKAKFDCMVFELTMGDIAPGNKRIFCHTSIPMLEIMLQTLHAQGCMKPGCRSVATHLARYLHTDHASTRERLAPLGVDLAYDGMIYEF
ncbi:MAG: hypothetical protein IJY27_02420 [Clostridia bacterium]|nr:hypothetical protein [Clostridia bacterium]